MATRRSALAAGALLAGCLLLAGCGTGSPAAASSPAGTGSRTLGALRITGAYIPQQSSPDVAAAYVTVTNTGAVGDVLDAVTTPAAPMVMLHDTVGNGATDRMVDLGSLPVPAHGAVAFTPGHRHLMLMNPVAMLQQGQVVQLTLHFAKAGAVTLAVPVVGLTGPVPAGSTGG